MKKISFIGLGKLGLPCAEVIKDKGFEVYADTSILCDHIGSYTYKVIQ